MAFEEKIQLDFEKSIVPLHLKKTGNKDELYLQGSSFYFEVSGRYYLSTAYHVLYEDDAMTQRIAEEFLYPTDGSHFENIPPFRLVDDQNKDFCVLCLTEPLKGFEAFPITPKNTICQDFNKFCCMGYPGTKSKQYNNHITSTLYLYCGFEETDSKWNKEKKPFEVAIRWIKSKCKNMGGIPIQFAQPEGMSGGPVVAYDGSEYCLYGNLTRYNPNLKRTFFATIVDYGKLAEKIMAQKP